MLQRREAPHSVAKFQPHKMKRESRKSRKWNLLPDEFLSKGCKVMVPWKNVETRSQRQLDSESLDGSQQGDLHINQSSARPNKVG